MSIGTWLGFVGFPVAFVVAARAAGTDRGHARTVVVVALVVIAALFAALLKWKTFSYLLTPLPLAALLLSDFIVSAVSRARTIAGGAVVVTLTGILAVESGAALIERHQRAARTTSVRCARPASLRAVARARDDPRVASLLVGPPGS